MKIVSEIFKLTRNCLTSRQHRLTSIRILCRILVLCPCSKFAQNMII